jgi:hypothetical protein
LSPDLATPSELLPGIAARGLATDYTDALVAPLVDIDDRLTEFVRGAEELGDAGGPVLDWLGDFAAEARGGLTDPEYRRLIAGRRVALEQTVVPGAVYRGWLGLTDPWASTMDEAAAEASLLAFVSYLPTTGWVQRVSVVARDLVADGVYAYGLIAQPGCFVWDVNSFDDAGFGFDFGV